MNSDWIIVELGRNAPRIKCPICGDVLKIEKPLHKQRPMTVPEFIWHCKGFAEYHSACKDQNSQPGK